MMKNVKANKTKQILLFEDEEAAQQFIAEHNKGAAMPEYTIRDGVSFDDLGRVFNLLAGQGVYMPIPDESLWKRAAAYHEQKAEQVLEYFNASGLTDEEKSLVTTDYYNALRGNYNFVASPKIMHSVLNKTKSYETFFIDKYGLWQMFQQYADYCGLVYYYAEQIRNADEETKYRFLNETQARDASQRAFTWALTHRYITLLDFSASGIPTQTLVEFTNFARKFAELYDYCSFYHVCKYAYLATPEELKSIRPPHGTSVESVESLTAAACSNAETAIQKAAEQFAAIINKDTPPQEQEQERERAERWNREFRLPVNYNRALQRPIEVSTTEQVKVTTALRTYIDGWLQLPTSARFRKEGVTVNEYTIQQVIGGLSLLKADRPQVKPVNGLLTYKLNISEFAEYCGYKYANSYVKEGFLGGLMILNNLFLIVERPERIRKKQNGKGVYKTGGKSAINLIRLRQYDTDKDDNITKIIIDIVAGNLGGELKPLSYDDIKKLQAEARGLFVSRFNAIIVGMDNKKEDAILDDCAGFTDMLDHAEGEEDRKATREYIRKKKPAARKRVQALFERYKELGVLTSYTRTQNRAGEWVYKWKRGTKQPTEPNQPELFTEAETVDAEQPETTQND